MLLNTTIIIINTNFNSIVITACASLEMCTRLPKVGKYCCRRILEKRRNLNSSKCVLLNIAAVDNTNYQPSWRMDIVNGNVYTYFS